MTATSVPEIGQSVPDFTLAGPGGQPVSLSEYRGKKNVVVLFFPLAFSPGCSHQLPEIERATRRYEALDAVVLGVSVDSHHANRAFARALGLSFPLLSDFDHATSRAWGVLIPERHHSGRAVFVVDKQGRLVHREVSATPDEIPSSAAVLAALERLAQGAGA